MPERHTLHPLARDLNQDLQGKALRTSSPQGRFAEAQALDGATLRQAFAIGKHLFLERDRGLVHIHLGLFGKVRRKRLELEARASARLGEGMYSRGQNRNARYHTALGSARETLSCLEVAAVFAYVREDEQLNDQLDRIVGTLVKLVRA